MTEIEKDWLAERAQGDGDRVCLHGPLHGRTGLCVVKRRVREPFAKDAARFSAGFVKTMRGGEYLLNRLLTLRY